MSADSTKKMMIVVLGVCFVCSILVSTAAVSLSAKQKENKELDKIKNILMAGNLLKDNINIKEVYKNKIQPVMIDLTTGTILPEEQYNESLNPETFEITEFVKDPRLSMKIPAKKDKAGIKKMPKYMVVYYVKEENEISKIIFPIYGKGLWSTLYGFIALSKDLKTIEGFTFYEHGETPGLGGEIDNPLWKKQWQGKLAFDDNWNVKIEVLKGKVDPGSSDAIYQIDGLSGSTLTTRGVDNLVKFWLGENGYGAFFSNLREEGIHEQI